MLFFYHLFLFSINLKAMNEKACCPFTSAPSKMRGSCWIYMPIPFYYGLKWLFWMRWMLFHHHGTSAHVQTYLGKFALPARSPMTSTWNGNIYYLKLAEGLRSLSWVHYQYTRKNKFTLGATLSFTSNGYLWEEHWMEIRPRMRVQDKV